jgi:hypothetical protein
MPIAVLMRSRNHELMSIDAGTMPSIETPMPLKSPITAWNCHRESRWPARRHPVPSNASPSG